MICHSTELRQGGGTKLRTRPGAILDHGLEKGLLGGGQVSGSRAHAFANKGGAPDQDLTSIRLIDE